MTLALEIPPSARIRASRSLALCTLLSVLFLPVLISWLGPLPPEQLHYTSAVAQIISSESGKETSSADQDVKLPDAWNQTRRGFGGIIEYVIDLRAIDSSREQSVL